MANEDGYVWYQKTKLGETCGPDTHCKDCYTSGCCDTCETVAGDGSWFDNIDHESCSTCDGPCAELTNHAYLVMDMETQLGYCISCIPGLSPNVLARLDKEKLADLTRK